MTGAQVFALLATLASAWSLVWNILAAGRAHRPHKTVYSFVAVFSAYYVVAWGWIVAFPDLNRGLWSEYVTPVSTASFFVVWAGPAMIAYFSQDPEKPSTSDPRLTAKELRDLLEEDQQWSRL